MRRILPMLCLLGLTSAAQGGEHAWSRFDWAQAEVVPGAGKVKAAINVPIKVNGVDCRAQLDTGAPGKVIWHRQADATLPGVDTVVELAGRSLTVKASAPQLAALEGGKCTDDVIASIGNAYFEDGTLTLDLKGSRLAFTTAASLAGERAAQPFNYAQWSGGDGGHIVVEIGMPNGKLAYAMLDTGAASFGISAMSEAAWSELTGGIPLQGSATVSVYKVNSWGKQIPCYETAAPGQISIGQMLNVGHLRASYCALEAFKPGQKLVGLLGLRDLNERTVTLDYRSRRWLISN
ncbi:hypothetical protein [Duganella sp. HH101]|uniref:hypothetical protein n=1 Tax=Duganella sp. HH101 TaxID=1781066 RepID=UPI000892DF3E|nr:hypothetical protein [Duganella sp. HH101]OFA04842.1 hypothetical protein DUGA2_15850 [Duganella sp. HH101]